ncbi:MAG: SPOR domain-containing protein [Desulfobacterales bacterium]|nr:SPOR domain-containing protein [Desulfobacterales bacterium]MBF0396989.1 SPOR domain-containing protein [Desulfobacterales bacterium]
MENKEKKQSRFVFLKIIFISAWMFSLGIFVGRGTAPIRFDINNLEQKAINIKESLQEELGRLKETFQKKEIYRFKINPEEAANKPDLEFYENLKKNDSNYNIMPQPKALTPPKPIVPPKPPEPVQKNLAESVTTTIDNTGKAEKKEPNVTIQVGSFKDGKEAGVYVDQLKKKGYPAYIVSYEVSGQDVWYRVRIGDFKTRQEASATLDKVKKEQTNAILISK